MCCFPKQLNPAQDARRGFTLVELLVVIAIIGLLVALLLPAVNAAREAARRSQCMNNLKQIGIGLHNYVSAKGSFPEGTIINNGADPNVPVVGTRWGWGTYILPYMEEQGVYDLMDFEKTVGSPVANAGGAELVTSYICPSAVTGENNWVECCSGYDLGGSPNLDLRETNYAGVSDTFDGFLTTSQPVSDGNGVFFNYNPVSFRKITDGTSKTLAVGEVTGGHGAHPSQGSAWIGHTWVTWNTQDTADGINGFGSVPGGRDDTLDGFDGDGSGNRHGEYYDESGFSSFHPGGALFLMCDGSVRFVEQSIDQDSLCVMTTRAKGDIDGQECRPPTIGPPRR